MDPVYVETLTNATITIECQMHTEYFEEEFYCYLFIMCPLAIIGVLLNLLSLKVFYDKSFNSVTFKYIRLITLTDCFICLIIIPYCVTAYTQPFNKYDLFARHFYLAYIYIPGANLAINLSMLLNLLVTIERLISVGWPTHKYALFKPSRYYLSCAIVILIALVSNISNLFLFKIEFCKNNLVPRNFLGESWWKVYGYVKEVLTRILPIIILIVANIMLIIIVRSSRKRMKESTSIRALAKKKLTNAQNRSTNQGNLFSSFTGKKSSLATRSDSATCVKQEVVELIPGGGEVSAKVRSSSSAASGTKGRSSSSTASGILQASTKKNRHESQLTIMTIVVAVLYCVTSIPMVFAYPGLVFSAAQTTTKVYKIYAVLVNILELVQCSFRFLIYFFFTTQFRTVLYKLFGVKYCKKQPNRQPDGVTLVGTLANPC